MADRSLAFRLTARETSITQQFEEDETGIGADHLGDIVIMMGVDHQWSTKERTVLGIVKVTDIPDNVIDNVERRMREEGYLAKVQQVVSGKWVIVSDVGYRFRRPKRFRVSKVLCLAKWPAMENQINKLFDPEFEVPLAAIPSLPWTGFREVLVDKLTDEATTGDELEEAETA